MIPLWGPSGGAGAVFSQAAFWASLTHSLVLDAGTGSPTFTRATTATVRDHEGVLRTVPAGCARFEGARYVRNLLTYTEDFSNAVWSITGVTRTATTITETAAGTDHSIRYTVASGKNIWQIKVKPNGRTRCALASTGSTNKSAIFNLTTMTVEGALTDAFTTLADSPTITLQSDGYYLITIGNLSGSTTLVDLYMLDATSTIRNYAGDITKGLYVKQAQLEDITGRADQTTPSEYVSVGVLSAPYHGAGVDGVKYFNTDLDGNPIAASINTGYVAEGARTNLIQYSNALDGSGNWDVNPGIISAALSEVGIDGATSAWSLLLNNINSGHNCQQQVTLAAGSQLTASVYAKYDDLVWNGVGIFDGGWKVCAFDVQNGTVGTAAAGVVGRIESVVNGFYRLSITYTTVGANPYIGVFALNANTTSISWASVGTERVIWTAAQLELGSFASSYIPTTTAAVTRNADVLTYPSAGNIDGTKGFVYCESTFATTIPTTTTLIAISFGPSLLPIYHHNNNVNAAFDGTNLVLGRAWSDTTTHKLGSTWGGSSVTIANNGQTDTGSFDGNMGSTSIGVGSDGTTGLCGTIRNVRIGQRQLSASEMQAITA